MTGGEVVLTSRRARWRTAERRWEAGRLRLSDRGLRLTARDGATIEVPVAALAAVRVVRWPRPTLVVVPADGAPLQIRCFAVPAVAAFLLPPSASPDRVPGSRNTVRRRARRRSRPAPSP